MGAFKIGGILLGNVVKKPATLMYPQVKREWQERTRGHVEIDVENCITCGICAKKCPTSAITVDKANRTWTIQRMACVQCGCCVESCPKTCLVMKNDYITPNTEKVVESFELPEKKPKE